MCIKAVQHLSDDATKQKQPLSLTLLYVYNINRKYVG